MAATALVKTEGAAALGEFAAPQGWIAEEAAPGVVRFTHPEFPGQVLSNGRTLRVQIMGIA